MTSFEWPERRLKHLVRSNPTKSEVRALMPETEVSFLPMESVGEYGGLDLSNTRPLEKVLNGYTYFREDDVLVAKITPCFENGKGALARGLKSELGFGTTELHVLRAKPTLDPRFLFYVTISDRFRKLGEAQMYGAGGQKRISEEFVEEFRIPFPPLSTQRAIASFLDRETERIDTLIGKKRRLLELLEEKRTGLITRAVTRGLDPDVPMKGSGVEWLGEIPEHWEVVKLKYLLRGPLQYGANSAGQPYLEELPRYIRITDIDEESALRDPSSAKSLAWEEARPYLLQAGDILLARSGATVGKSFLMPDLPGPAAFAGYLIRVRPKRQRLIPKWLWFFTRSAPYANWLDTVLIQATIQNVSAEKYGNLPIPLPPRTIQERISSELTEDLEHLASVRSRIQRAISLLQEYRTALISAAVTGKIDVRDKVPA